MTKQKKIKLYAKALADVISVKGFDEKKVVNNFFKLIISEGLEKKAKEIFNLVEEITLLKQGRRKVVFETARAMNGSQRKLIESIVKKDDVVEEKINPELIAGIKIIINNLRQFDASVQSKLSKLF